MIATSILVSGQSVDDPSEVADPQVLPVLYDSGGDTETDVPVMFLPLGEPDIVDPPPELVDGQTVDPPVATLYDSGVTTFGQETEVPAYEPLIAYNDLGTDFEPLARGGVRCPLVLGCCEEDCCGEGTSWESPSCILNPNSSGFDGTYSSAYNEGCILRTCCEDQCCSPGTEYDSSTALCVPQGTPSTGRLAYRDPGSCPKPASDNCPDINDPVNCDGCAYSNQCEATAANSTFTPDTCLNATQLQLV